MSHSSNNGIVFEAIWVLNRTKHFILVDRMWIEYIIACNGRYRVGVVEITTPQNCRKDDSFNHGKIFEDHHSN